ncbi:MAG: hypothetical protein NUV34_08595 [Sulfuricaulis sp.]|nr:hypothetical protein [Sulfuricaulis sp.]
MNDNPVTWWGAIIFVAGVIVWYGMFLLPFVWAPLLIVPVGILGFAVWRSFNAHLTTRRRK